MLLFTALKNRSFALLWTSQTISRLGDSLYQIALAWWVLEKTGSAVAMGSVLVVTFIPTLLFVLIGGATVDRFSRLKVMLTTDLISGTVVTFITILAFSDRLEIWHIYVASVLFGFASAFFQPAYSAAIPEVAHPDVLTSANSLTSLSRKLSRTVGPLIGASIISIGGTSLAFALDALSFFISIACLMPLVGIYKPERNERKETSIIRDINEGISIVFALPWLWITIMLLSLINLTQWGPVSVSLPFLVKERLEFSVGALGIVFSMLPFGSVAAAIWFGRSRITQRRGIIAYSALVISGLMTSLLGFSVSILTVSFAAFLVGASSEIFNLIWMQTIQELVPRNALGRVLSIDYLVSLALLPIGYGFAGWATDQIGASTVFVVGGLISAVLAAAGLIHPQIRALK